MATEDYSVYLSGVGGQGLVLLSNIIGTACASAGLRVITGEQHGLSQRSGSINIHLRIGEDIRSPLIPIGGADVLVSLEALEALRYVEYLRQGGVALLSSRVQNPVEETQEHTKDKEARYFSAGDVEERLREVTDAVAVIDALGLAREAGNSLTENIVMLGALSALADFPVPEADLRQAIMSRVPAKAVDVNLRAFLNGGRVVRDTACNAIKCRESVPPTDPNERS
jgi:indolepyruvate ferredoxin oxidoreductase beta subunit